MTTYRLGTWWLHVLLWVRRGCKTSNSNYIMGFSCCQGGFKCWKSCNWSKSYLPTTMRWYCTETHPNFSSEVWSNDRPHHNNIKAHHDSPTSCVRPIIYASNLTKPTNYKHEYHTSNNVTSLHQPLHLLSCLLGLSSYLENIHKLCVVQSLCKKLDRWKATFNILH